MSDSNPVGSRQHGVELGELNRLLRSHSYPATTGELLDAYGDVEIQLENGSQSFADVLGPFPGESFASADAVRVAVFTLVDEQAVGRKGYSDRDPPTLGERTDRPPESL